MAATMQNKQRLGDAARQGIGRKETRKSAAPLLHGEAAAKTLVPAEDRYIPGIGPTPTTRTADNPKGKLVKTYRWNEFGEDQVTDFYESHFELDGEFESNSSAGHKEYQDRLRAIALKRDGLGKGEIAAALNRSEKFVTKWWSKSEKEIPRPHGVHAYLGGNMGSKTATSGAAVQSDTVTDTASWWRDVEIKRGFAADPDIYKEILHHAEWKSAAARTRDFRTGSQLVKYDKEGKMKLQGNQNAKYQHGLSPAFDKALQKLFALYGIEGRTSGIGLNWYPDGQSVLGSHRHDCWTALFSFGEERILTIDKTPLLCRDGDMVIFGTQRHGVPKMPEISEGRITVPIFFYPNHLQMKKKWQTLTDDDITQSRAAVAMARDTELADGAQETLWNEHSFELEQVLAFGFDEDEAKRALVAYSFDVATAVESLFEERQALPSCCKIEEVEPDQDERQVEDDEEATLALVRAMQLEELEEQRQQQQYLQAQFEQYEAGLDRSDAERWNGFGDLMISERARTHLKLDTMDKVTLYSVGHGDLSEKNFWAMLVAAGIRTLYDFRAADSRGEVWAPAAFLSVKAMRSACRSRGLRYKQVALGREDAYGILPHLRSDEGQHALVELCWQAKHHARAAFLGRDEDWTKDQRLAIAEEFHRAGHRVEHVTSSGTFATHKGLEGNCPDWLLQQEAALRKREAMRKSGELRVVEKSRHSDRSTEAMASRLMRPPEEIDAMQELQSAANQVELEKVQRKLGRMYRVAQNKGEMANRVVTSVPKWIKEEAESQRQYIANKQAEKEAKLRGEKAPAASKPQAQAWVEDTKPAGAAGFPRPDEKAPAWREEMKPAGAEQPQSVEEELQVECQSCGKLAPWNVLEARSGRCQTCEDPAPDADLQVECARCPNKISWAALAEGDGLCTSCARVPKPERSDSNPEPPVMVECVRCHRPGSWAELAPGDGKCQGCVRGLPKAKAARQAWAPAAEELVVECAGCGKPSKWSVLEAGDGRCAKCRQ
mmetsp:Transcript_13885/g.34001  ORF Transcript_13885/g.34001 Transcript_13885/m.34001 type:complete len:1002 (-) Transcript_13885:149-3154(-)